MYDRRLKTIGSVARWMAVLPLVLVGSMLFWTLAFGLGSVSLLALTGLAATSDEPSSVEIAPTATEPVSGHVEPITVHIEESTEPEDVNDNAGVVAPAPADEDTLQAHRGL